MINTIGIATFLYLDKNYVNIKPAVHYKLINAQGKEFILKTGLSNEGKRFLSESNVSIEEVHIERPTRGSNVLINGIVLELVEPNVLKYNSMGNTMDEAKDLATARFNTVLDNALQEQGYKVNDVTCHRIQEVKIDCPNGLQKFGFKFK